MNKKSTNYSSEYQRLEEESTILCNIMKYGPAWVNICDQNGVITRINNAGISLMEASCADDLIGHRLLDFAINMDFEGCQSELIPDKVKKRNITLQTLKGNMRWVEVRTIYLSGNADHAKIVSILWDKTKETISKARQLEQQEKLAKILKFNTLGALSSGLAHELNQPLSALSHYLYGCEKRIKTQNVTKEEILDVIQLMEIQTERAIELINQIKDFSIQDSNKLKPININKIIQSTVDLTHSLGQTDNIRYIMELDEDLTKISISKTHIEQILVNLICNAVESMGDAKVLNPTIIISSKLCDDMSHVSITIEDNGNGFTKDQLENIVTPFSSGKINHMGVGLNITRTIVELYAGSLKLSNNPKKQGAQVRFTFPI